MALTGFNPDEVSRSINSVKQAYEELIKALADDMQREFVGGMADKWACRQAQTFFSSAFKPAIDSLINSSNTIFQSVADAMNSAAQNWASTTDGTFSKVAFSTQNKTMDVSGIQENIGGVRGIDLQSANSVAAKLGTIASSASSALGQAQSAVQNCGFIGGSQASNLISSLGTIKSKISQSTEELANQTKEAINQTVQTYSDTEGKVSQAFSASN